ncbi:hypothetical protein IWW43_005874, partial [Coemansia sp. RSA 1935]
MLENEQRKRAKLEEADPAFERVEVSADPSMIVEDSKDLPEENDSNIDSTAI